MRYLATLLILLSTMFTAVAQNYQCVQPGAKRYFINNNYYLRGIRIDSVKTVGTTQYLYPFRSYRGFYELDSNGGSWLGKVITVQDDGITYFDNYWGDTTFIHTQAALHDSWLFYTDTTDVYYTATVTAIDTATIEGTIDSVKKITLACYNGSGLLTTDTLHGAQLLLSKTHGLVQAFDFYIFPMHEPNKSYQQGFDYTLDASTLFMADKSALLFRLCHFDNPLMTELYDYNPGDRFVHEYYLGGYPYTTMLDVLEKRVTADSIVYGGYSYSQQYVPVQGIGYQTNCVYSTIAIPRTAFIDTNLMPEEWGTRDFYYYHPADTTYCRTGGLYTTHANFILYPDNHVNILEPTGHQYSYKKGLGITRHYYQNGSGPLSYTEPLIAFTKTGEPQCGRVAALSVAAKQTADGFLMYPNPANDVLHIEAKATGTLYLINTFGQIVHTVAIQNGKVSIPTATLPAGNYVLKLESAGAAMHHRTISVAH